MLPEEVDVMRLVFREPQLLRVDTSAVVMRMLQLAALLPGHDVAALIESQPTLLAGTAPGCTARWESCESDE